MYSIGNHCECSGENKNQDEEILMADMAFHNETSGIPSQEPRESLIARTLAAVYVKLTEDYNRMACTGQKQYGVAMPYDEKERELIVKHARKLFGDLADTATLLGCPAKELRKAIRDTH